VCQTVFIIIIIIIIIITTTTTTTTTTTIVIEVTHWDDASKDNYYTFVPQK
jgi:hypothetical protein